MERTRPFNPRTDRCRNGEGKARITCHATESQSNYCRRCRSCVPTRQAMARLLGPLVFLTRRLVGVSQGIAKLKCHTMTSRSRSYSDRQRTDLSRTQLLTRLVILRSPAKSAVKQMLLELYLCTMKRHHCTPANSAWSKSTALGGGSSPAPAYLRVRNTPLRVQLQTFFQSCPSKKPKSR